jgi:thioredoxin reductase
VKALSYSSVLDRTSRVDPAPIGAATARSLKPSTCRVAVVGAGPYGLAVTSYLRKAGVETRVFGEVMELWRHHMPKGMLVRSGWAGSHIADPYHMLTLDRYETELRTKIPRALMPRDDFVKYALWYQRRAVPDVDERRVTWIEAGDAGFRLLLSDGEVVEAERVVVATGLMSFVTRPTAFASIPATLAPHSSDVREPESFRGLRVVVIGAGQSALELTALVREAGADVEVIARQPEIRWRKGGDWLRQHTAFRKVVYPPGEVGPLGVSWVIELAGLFRRLPPKLKRRWHRAGYTPAGSHWLRPRLSDVAMTVGRSIVSADAVGERLRLVLDDGSEREVDRVILGTGYRVNVGRSPILAPELALSVRQNGGYPLLGDGFESSVPGLHFVGAAAAETFGPLMFFVAGTGYTARSLTRRIVNSGARWAITP